MKWTTGSLPRGGAGDHTAGHHDNTSMKWRWQPFQLSGLGYRRNEVALLVGPGWESKSPQNKGESPTISQLPPIVCKICTVTFFLLQRYCWDVCISLFYQKSPICPALNIRLRITLQSPRTTSFTTITHKPIATFVALRLRKICAGGI